TTKDSLQANCSLVGLAKVGDQSAPGAVQLSSGVYGIPLLVNPAPGTQGNLSKTIKISETKSVQIRFDATNILNHATPQDPIGVDNGRATTGTSSFVNTLGNGFGQIQIGRA